MSSSLRTFLRTIQGVQVVGQAFTPADVLQALAEHKPHILILDVDLIVEKTDPVASLVEFFKQVSQACSCFHSIVLVNTPTQKQIVLAIGADKALLKGALDEQLRQLVIQASLLFVPPHSS